MSASTTAPVPRLRDSLAVYREGAHGLRFVKTSEGSDICFEVDEFALAVVSALDRVETFDELYREIESIDGFSEARVAEVLDVLKEERLVVAPEPLGDGALGAEVADRYDRQLRLFREWIADGTLEQSSPHEVQARLAASTVCIVGLGGVGGSLARCLAAAGVGRLRLCDPDVVELSNLNRQSIYITADVGSPKVSAAADHLLAQTDRLVVEMFTETIEADTDLAALVEGCELVVNCADMPSVHLTSDWIAAACITRGIPHIVGGGYGYRMGILGTTVVPGTTACWTCMRRATADDVAARDAVLIRAVQRPTGVLGALSEALAAITAIDAVLLLVGATPRLSDGIAELDALTLELRRRSIPRDPRCPSCASERGAT